MHITNLASHDLVMEIVQNSFIHNLYVSSINIVHWKHIWHKFIGRCKIHVTLFVHRFVLHPLTHLSMCQMCFQHMIFMRKCMNLWMNELCTIFIINSSHAKFVMYAPSKVIHWNIASTVCLFVCFCSFQPLLKILNTYVIKCLSIITIFSPNLVQMVFPLI